MQAVTNAFGEPTNYYAIDGGTWPPQAILRCARGDAIVLVTCGMQLRPQPTLELYAEDPRPFRRIELGLAIERHVFELAPNQIMGWLSGQAKYPWHRLLWFGNHHTMPCDSIPTGPSRQAFTGCCSCAIPSTLQRLLFERFGTTPSPSCGSFQSPARSVSWWNAKAAESWLGSCRRTGTGSFIAIVYPSRESLALPLRQTLERVHGTILAVRGGARRTRPLFQFVVTSAFSRTTTSAGRSAETMRHNWSRSTSKYACASRSRVPAMARQGTCG